MEPHEHYTIRQHPPSFVLHHGHRPGFEPLPFGEIVPLYGVYAEGFWDRQLTPMPDSYKNGFHFSILRTDNAIGTDLLGQRDANDAPDVARYPYLTCEIGAGMMASYHRRILVYPSDAESTTLVKLGSGGASLGYYMYHGGENPDGKLTTLQESQATGSWNDLPVKNYDFQTALGQYGQIRPQYHRLRRFHLFLHEWGAQLAAMSATMPDQRPHGKNDFDTLRWCVRSDGTSGFVFVNNYQRLQEMSPKTNIQFTVNLPSGPITFPERPVTIPSDACLIWPFHLDLGKGVRLTSTNRDDLHVAVYPAPAAIAFNGEKLRAEGDGIFERCNPQEPAAESFQAAVEVVQAAGPPRNVPLGGIGQPVAAEPEDSDFEKAAVWRVKLPEKIDLNSDPILRLHYAGDVARVTLNGKLLTDDFYNGNEFEAGLRRYAPEILTGDLRVAVLPLRKDAPIYLAKEAKPDFGDQQSIVSLSRVEIVPHYQIKLKAQ